MGPISIFLKEFKQHTRKDVSIDEIGYETVRLYKEEIGNKQSNRISS